MNQNKDGFSLVELMVVIAIISFLISLLLPAVMSAKRGAQGASCLGNLKQWGNATLIYTIDNEGLLPQDGSPNGISKEAGWYVELPRAVDLPTYHEMEWRTNASVKPGRSWWICPSNRRRSNGTNLFHYCLNKNVNDSGTGNQILISTVQRPSKVVWMFDNGKLAAVAQQGNVHTNIHRGGAHFTFLDGHAERFPRNAYWDVRRNKPRNDHPDIQWYP